MTTHELFPPKGYYRADEAYRHWMNIRFDHRQLLPEEIDQTREQFVSWMESHRLLVNIYTKDGTAHEVPVSAWERKWFPDMLVLHKSIPYAKGSPFEGYAGAILIVHSGELDHWATSELKDELFDELRYGRMELPRARIVAAKAGIESLEGNPDPAGYNPMAEPYWSLPMTIAWIATRAPGQVRERWDKYLEKCFFFRHERWRLGFDGEIYTGWKCDNRELASINLFFGEEEFSVAKSVLFRALKLGEIAATGLREQGTGREPIPGYEWQDLSCPTLRGKEVFRPAAGTSGYMGVTVARDAVLAHWPAPIAIWDFALGKCSDDTDCAGRLSTEIYAAFWKGELGVSELSFAEGKLFNQPGVDTLNGLSREYLAGAAIGGSKLNELGYSVVIEQLAKWNIADYAKVDGSYRHYFVPDRGIGSLGSQGRGLCAPPDVLEAWFRKHQSPPSKLALAIIDAADLSTEKIRADATEVAQWLFMKVKEHPNSKAPPDKEKLYGAHQSRFQNRAMLKRDFYKLRSQKDVLPKSWTTQGRRKSGWHSRLSTDWKHRLGIP